MGIGYRSPLRLLYSSKLRERRGGPMSRDAITGFVVSEMLREAKEKKIRKKIYMYKILD